MWKLAGDEIEMDGTSVVNPVSVFEQDSDGKWKNSGRQETDKATGLPLWEVGVTWLTADRYGVAKEASYNVLVPSRTMPLVGRHEPIRFEGLALEYYYHRGSQTIRETLTATAIVED